MDGTGRKPSTPGEVENPEAPPELPLELAAKLDGLPAEYQEAVAVLVAKVGLDGLCRIAAAISTKKRGHPGYDQHNEPLLRQMGELLQAHPGWKVHKAAEAVMRSAAGKAELKRSGGQPSSLVRRLREHWKKHGPRILRELRQSNQKRQSDAELVILHAQLMEGLAVLRNNMPAFWAALPTCGRQLTRALEFLRRAAEDPAVHTEFRTEVGRTMRVLHLITNPGASKAIMDCIAPGCQAVQRLMEDPKSLFGRPRRS